MPSSPPPTDPSQRLQWLVDRAEISDLLVEFARCLDEHDGAGYAAVYTEDGVLDFPGMRLEGREQIAGSLDLLLSKYDAVWHLSSNHAIEIEGDEARTRSYVIGVHRHGDDLNSHADLGGWYDKTLRRTPEGWRITHVTGRGVWAAGEGPLPH